MMFGSKLKEKVIKKLGSEILIDLGTYSTKMSILGSSEIMEIPTIIGLGNEEGIFQKFDSIFDPIPKKGITVKRPFQKGVVFDYFSTELFLRVFLQELLKNISFSKKILGITANVAIHTHSSEVQISAITDALNANSINKVNYIYKPIAGVYGVRNVTSTYPLRIVLCSIGHSISELITMEGNKVLESKIVRIGGENINLAIDDYLKSKYSLELSESSLESLKTEISFLESKSKVISIVGKNMQNGKPSNINIREEELLDIIKAKLGKVLEQLIALIEDSPKSFSDCIHRDGVFMIGGSSKFEGLEKHFSKELGVKINKVLNPENKVLEGLSFLAQSKVNLQEVRISDFIML